MALRIDLLLTIISALTVSAIFKDETEYVYTYNGEMKIGSKTPTEFYSYSQIKADLHVKPIDKDLYIFLKNVKYAAYSGSVEKDKDGATKDVPLPNDSQIFLEPFIYHRYTNDSKTGISASKDDELWSIKIKQAIASMLYLNEDELDRNQTKKCYSLDFLVCSSYPNGDYIQVLASNRVSNRPYNGNPPISEAYPIVRRTYDLKMEKDGYTLERVSSKSSYNHHQNLNVFYANVEQSLELVEKKNSDLNVDVTKLIYNEPTPELILSLHKNDERSNNVPDDDDDILKLKTNLESVYEYLKYQGLTIKWSIPQLNELDDLIYELKDLTVERLNHFYSLISKNLELCDLFLDTVILTNSPKAYCFIIKTIERGKLDEKQQINLLTKMASNPIPLTECLENGLLKLSNDKSLGKIRHQAVITLASMIRASKDDNKYEHIVNGFIESFNKSENDDERSIYVHALFNVDSENTLAILSEIIQGASGYEKLSGHIRALAANSLKYNFFTDYVFEDLIDNDKQDIEIRATALNVLLNSLNEFPSLNLIEILSNNEKNEDLYQMLYTKIEAISKKTSGDGFDAKEAKNILNQLQKPKKRPTFATSRIFEYANEMGGKGLVLEMTTFGNMVKYKFITCRFKLTVKDVYLNEYSYEFYAHVTEGSRYFTHDDLLRVLFNRNSNMEMFLKKDGYVVSVTPLNLRQLLSKMFNNKVAVDTISADQVKNVVKYIPTEMGTSIVFSDRLICMDKIDLKTYIMSSPEEILLDFNGRYKCLNYYDLSAYNPIANLWNGAKSVASAFINIPIELHVKSAVGISPSLAGNATLNVTKLPLGLQMSLRNFVYMEGEENDDVGKISCAECDVHNLITQGENHRENKVFFDEYSEDVGLQFSLAAFDCERHLTMADFVKKQVFNPNDMCGIILAVGNERQPVTQLEFAYHVKVDADSYFDELNLITNNDIEMNYSVKNGDEVLKKWDVTFKCNDYMHNRSECAINAVSKKDDVIEHTIHSDISMEYNHDDVHRTFKIISNEQTEFTNVYIENTETSNSELNSMINQEELLQKCDEDKNKKFDDCLIDMSMFRLSSYNISYTNLKPEYLTILTKISDLLRLKYSENFHRIHKYDNGKDNVKIKIARPINRDGVYLSIIQPNEAYEYRNVIFNKIMPIQPYSEFKRDLDDTVYYCELGTDYISEEENGDRKALEYGSEWVNIASRCEDGVGKCPWSVKVKKGDSNDLALRFTVDEDVVEVGYKEGVEIKLNDAVLEVAPNKMVKVAERLDVMRLTHKGETTRVILRGMPMKVNIEMMKSRIRMSLPFFRSGKARFSN